MKNNADGINTLLPELKEKFLIFRKRYKEIFPHRDIILTCAHRSAEEQSKLYSAGRNKQGKIIDKTQVITYCDGKNKVSPHNYFPSRAFDFMPSENGKPVDARLIEKYFIPAGKIITSLGLVWGGNWKKLKDYCHAEIV